MKGTKAAADADASIITAVKAAADEVRDKGGASTEVAEAAVAAAKKHEAKTPWRVTKPRSKGKKGVPPKIEKPFDGLSESPATVVGIRDREALDSFIEQLEACRKHSHKSGGCYSAFLHHEHGQLRVEVWLTPDPVKLAKVSDEGIRAAVAQKKRR